MTGFFSFSLPRLTDKSTDALCFKEDLIEVENWSILTGQGISPFLGSELDVRRPEIPVSHYILLIHLADADKTAADPAHHMPFPGYLGRHFVPPTNGGQGFEHRLRTAGIEGAVRGDVPLFQRFLQHLRARSLVAVGAIIR